MDHTLQKRLLWREQGVRSHACGIRALYGDPYWVHNLDIVNELGGHHGCVNALSWSKSGRLLASGSDDTNLLIHRYQADGTTKPFSLATEISTGHTANIFSVKFMPHSNDNTLVSCAGDSEVRVFDIEYSPRTRRTETSGSLGFRGGEAHDGVRYLSEGDTNARVYRSHADRVKRIVTESSPHLFLTCSEDGEVRQWDLRLPSSAYPEPPNGRMLFTSRRHRSGDEARGRVPPPLISYRKYRLDLNTISCSASQPYYIALGGAHLHCFLHDRRMIGRDLAVERGSDSPYSIDTDFRGDDMGKATRCVRRFAPEGKKKMERFSNGHITACKISDARPNEMVVSWSGDHIYSFDLLRSPDATERSTPSGTINSNQKHKGRESLDRKRKRLAASSPTGDSASKHQRSRSLSSTEKNEDVALRVRYGNGQSEDIAIETTVSGADVDAARDAVLTPWQRRSVRIAKGVVKIRKLLFSLDEATSEESETVAMEQSESSQAAFEKAARLAKRTLMHIDRVTAAWRYPVDPDSEEVAFQTALRRQRDRTRRFVQAAGTIAKLLWSAEDEAVATARLDSINEIRSPTTESLLQDNSEIFRYDFIKAILAWLNGGTDGLLAAFREGSQPTRQAYRFPVPKDGGPSAIDRYLIRHLLLLATEEPVPDLERSRFEHDATRQLFETERYAVTAFAHIVDIAAEAQRGEENSAEGSVRKHIAAKARSYDPATTRRFWGFKVARGLLMNAAEGVDFTYVDRAFGGVGQDHRVDAGRDQTDIDPAEDDPTVEHVQILRRPRSGDSDDASIDSHGSLGFAVEDVEASDEDAMFLLSHLRDEHMHEESDSEEELVLELEDDDSEDNEDESDDGSEGDDEDEDEDGESPPWGHRRLMWQSASERAQLREAVDSDVPVNAHTRIYRGHCNVKTVKDVNYYGLDDDYIVSGSDSGHVFIWDRKSTKLLNILEGDGDIVNVIQGHPYEPMLAVSGIDHTVKIFSSDSRAQRDARLGKNLAATQRQSEGNFTTIGRRRFTRPPRRDSPTDEPLLGHDENPDDNDPAAESARTTARWRRNEEDSDLADHEDGDDGQPRRAGLTSKRRMHDLSRITAQNKVDREGGMHDAYITVGLTGLEPALRPIRMSFAAWQELFR